MRSLRQSLSLLMLIVFCAAGLAIAADFQIGNLNPPVGPALPDYVHGMTAFAYLVYPPDQATCPEQGFYMESIHMLLEFPAGTEGMAFLMSAALYSAEIDPVDGALKPGAILCLALDVNYMVLDSGLQDMTVPFSPCVPVQMDDHYFLVMSYDTPLEANLPVDGMPQPGIVFMDDGTGWVDMFSMDKTPAGKSIIWGDITCGIPPVAAEAGTWSGIKSLYQ